MAGLEIAGADFRQTLENVIVWRAMKIKGHRVTSMDAPDSAQRITLEFQWEISITNEDHS